MNALEQIQNQYRNYQQNPAVLDNVTMDQLDRALQTDLRAKEDLIDGTTILNTASAIALIVLPIIFIAIPGWICFFITAPLTYYAYEMTTATDNGLDMLTNPRIRTKCLISKPECMHRAFSTAPVMKMIMSCVKINNPNDTWESLASGYLGVGGQIPFRWAIN